jgi:hypothetical protein
MDDPGYQGIQRTCPGGVSRRTKPSSGRLTQLQNEENRLTTHDRVLVEERCEVDPDDAGKGGSRLT